MTPEGLFQGQGTRQPARVTRMSEGRARPCPVTVPATLNHRTTGHNRHKPLDWFGPWQTTIHAGPVPLPCPPLACPTFRVPSESPTQPAHTCPSQHIPRAHEASSLMIISLNNIENILPSLSPSHLLHPRPHLPGRPCLRARPPARPALSPPRRPCMPRRPRALGGRGGAGGVGGAGAGGGARAGRGTKTCLGAGSPDPRDLSPHTSPTGPRPRPRPSLHA